MSTIKIDFDFEYNKQDLHKSIVRRAAYLLLEQIDIGDQVEQLIQSEVSSRLVELVDEAFKEIIQPTNEIGKPTGPALSMREYMIEHIQNFMDAKVDRNGKPVDACSYHTPGSTRAKWIAEKAAEDIWGKHVSKQIDTCITKLRKEIEQRAINRFAEKLKKFLDD